MRRCPFTIFLLISLCLSFTTLDGQAADNKNLTGQIAYELLGEIYVYDIDSGRSTQITTSGNNRMPDWSYDGKYLLYIHGIGESGTLVVIDSNLKEISSFPARAGQWAWDTHEIFWITRDNSGFFRSGIDGKNPEVVFDMSLKPSNENWDDFSVGKHNGVIVSRREKSQSGTQGYFRQLAKGWESYYETYLAPDFRDQRTEFCMFSLDESRASGAWAFVIDTNCMMFAPGAEVIYVSYPTARYLDALGGDPAWSPDSNYLVYRYMAMCTEGPGMCHAGIAIIDLRTDEVTQIVENPDARNPAWQPQSQAIEATPTQKPTPIVISTKSAKLTPNSEPTDVPVYQDENPLAVSSPEVIEGSPDGESEIPELNNIWQRIINWFKLIFRRN
jgi:hypothetical protein